jgi:hypothetical protein
MKHGNGAPDTPLYTLIPLADFKAILGKDYREDALSRYCLITATYTVEQYCKRRLVRRKHTESPTFTVEHIQGPNGFFCKYDFSGPHAVQPYSSTRSMFHVHYWAWNMTRYRGRRIGMTGNLRGSGKDGEHLESSMPENVRQLLEPYR